MSTNSTNRGVGYKEIGEFQATDGKTPVSNTPAMSWVAGWGGVKAQETRSRLRVSASQMDASSVPCQILVAFVQGLIHLRLCIFSGLSKIQHVIGLNSNILRKVTAHTVRVQGPNE